MRRRGLRVSHIVVIAVSLAFALFGLWYRTFVGTGGVLAQGGTIGLIAYLCGQLLLDAETELAIQALNYRIDEECRKREGR